VCKILSLEILDYGNWACYCHADTIIIVLLVVLYLIDTATIPYLFIR